jgi:hypothetical protein
MNTLTITVKVLLNQTSFYFTTEDRLWQALEFESGFPCGHVSMLLDIVYRQLTNTDDPSTDWADWAIQYRRDENNRALSVGDVVVIGEQAYAIEPIAWRRVTVNRWQLVDGPVQP